MLPMLTQLPALCMTVSSVAVGLAFVAPPVNPAEGETTIVSCVVTELLRSRQISKFVAIPVCRSTIQLLLVVLQFTLLFADQRSTRSPAAPAVVASQLYLTCQ